ncbi:glycosyl hydrolase [Mucilaginibacter psychrotolerans]|uniref:Asl1-like glycosyl hydrolase catalytic domain-containing protein n=1 Tax=Mucilaginibacter psychrotolerans TaxID=1524096 RepID=A0A4Y8S2K0_9SPHI|nr:glycosyl hydrolase [Mucilaginibacter psychrotolerans]TFF33278.1 hypothetical protein E2R66_26735 [Mucilaginibacter psychrotolerans]
MIKNSLKSLTALVCAASLLASCKKDSFIHEKTTTPPSSLASAKLETTSIQLSSTLSAPFILGVNGHPLGDVAYLDVPASDQVNMIKKMGMGIYRINILSTSDGTCTVPKVLQPLLDAAAANKITLLPMLTPRTLSYNDSEMDAYQKGKTLGGNFAAKYASVFKFYDMGNDIDLATLLAGKDGRVTEDYNLSKLRIAAAYLKGMSEGIHANDPDAQTMISAGWVHWGFIKFCETNGVKFDVLAYHWYSDMEAAIVRAKSLNITDITLTLNKLFPDKPIWITETNFRADNLSTLESDQNTFLTSFITKCKANPTVKAVLVYELFDEPYKNGAEKNYGIAKWVTPYLKWINKMVANTFEKLQVIGSNPEISKPSAAPGVIDLLANVVGYTTAKPITAKMTVGSTYYTDRVYQITSMPAYLNNASLIKTANDDKLSKLSTLVSFKLNRPATIYVAYDPRANRLPAWLQIFTKTAENLAVNDPKLATMNIYKKDYEAGSYSLGGNLSDSATGALCQYVLMVNEK